MDRRQLLKGFAALPALPALPALAQGDWPTRNVTMIVPFPPGGQADLAARPVAAALEKILGRGVIVENRGGAGGAVGNAAAARAEPDGYTLLMTLSSLAVLPEADRLFERKPAYEVTQLAPVARVLADPTLLAIPADAPWKTLQDFVDDAKKRPGEIPYGSSGPYGTLHVSMEMFATEAGIKLLHVPYRGAGPAVTALLAGQIQALASAPGVLKPQVDERQAARARELGRRARAELPRSADLQGARLPECRVLHLGRPVRAEGRAGADHDAPARGDAPGDGRPRGDPRPSRTPAARRPTRTRRTSPASSRPTAPG